MRQRDTRHGKWERKMTYIIYKTINYDDILHFVVMTSNKYKAIKIATKLRKKGYYVQIHCIKPPYILEYKTIYYPIM